MMYSSGGTTKPQVFRRRGSKMAATQGINFTVKNIEKAIKSGFVKVDVKFDGNDKIYTYIRKTSFDGFVGSVIIDGCKVNYDRYTFDVLNVVREYDTKGVKKLSTAGQSKGSKKGDSFSFNDPVNDYKSKLDDIINNDDVTKVNNVSKFPKVDLTKPVKHSKYDTIKTCLSCDVPVYLAGPAGSGKNFTVEQIAEDLGWKFFFSNSVQQEYKLTGFIDAAGDFHETEFYKACTSDKPCVFFLDEIDASIPEVLVLLNAAIANGYFEFPTGRVNLDNVHFVAAGNTVGSGADELYTGRMVIDQATLDRFAIIEFGYDTSIEMAMAKNDDDLVEFIHDIRDAAEMSGVRATFSYRCITMAKKLEDAGMDLVEVIKISIVKGLDKDTINSLSMVKSGTTRFARAFEKVA